MSRAQITIDQDRISEFCRRWNLRELSIFGSALRTDFRAASDVDVLIELPPNRFPDLDEWDVMRSELTELLGRRVDLISKRGIENPFVRHQIMSTRGNPVCRLIRPALLWDMLDAARKVREATVDVTFDQYLADWEKRYAIERAIEIIGEAAGRISTEFQTQHPSIPWTKIKRQRNVLIHDYGRVNHELIWRVVTDHIPELISSLEPLVPPPPST